MNDITLSHRVLHQSARSLGRHLADLMAWARHLDAGIQRLTLLSIDAHEARLHLLAASDSATQPLFEEGEDLANLPALMRVAISGTPATVPAWRAAHRRSLQATPWLLLPEPADCLAWPLEGASQVGGLLLIESDREAAFTPATLERLTPLAATVDGLLAGRASAAARLVGAVRAAGSMVRVRGIESDDHLLKVSRYAELIARGLARRGVPLPLHFLDDLVLYAPLHDIGKALIPDELLGQRATLTPAQQARVRLHVEHGERLALDLLAGLGLQNTRDAEVLLNIVRAHHERCDGSGYPRGLRREQIPLEARIVAVADVYDALSSPRPHRPAWAEDRCIDALREEARTTRLDPDCVEALLSDAPARLAIRDADGAPASGRVRPAATDGAQPGDGPCAMRSEVRTTWPCATGTACASARAT